MLDVFKHQHSPLTNIKRAATRGLGAIAERFKRGDAIGHRFSFAHLQQHVIIPTGQMQSAERMRTEILNKGRALSRQEDWDTIIATFKLMDVSRAKTPCGIPHADLLAHGSRADALNACVKHARKWSSVPSEAGVIDLEAALADHLDQYPAAIILAQLHLDLARLWRNAALSQNDPNMIENFDLHMERAREVLAPFDAMTIASPALAATQCELLDGIFTNENKVSEGFSNLISLDKTNPRAMRAFGKKISPSALGSRERLEIEARRTAVITREIWGDGGYVWVYFDIIASDAGAYDWINPAFFADGIRDILNRKPSQVLVNQLAALTGIALRTDMPELTPRQREVRAQLASHFDTIVREHLRELHPLIWADAAHQFQPIKDMPEVTKLETKGYEHALNAIAGPFKSQLEQGGKILFASDGVRYQMPA